MTKGLRLGVLTGGGDCPGLNALLRAVVKRGVLEFGHSFVGIADGFRGLVEDGLTSELTLDDVRGILPKGGTILGTSNRANPFRYAVRGPSGWEERDLSAKALERYRALGLEGLIIIGGDGTLSIGHGLSQLGMRIVGCPKTIDNDLSGTDQTFGFDTARAICTDAVDKLHTTAEAHQRVMVLEVMGRNAGFLALESGVAGGADVVLLPEIPYRLEAVLDALRRRAQRQRSFSIIVVAEGAKPLGGELAVESTAAEVPGRGVVRLGGAGKVLADALSGHLEAEIRGTVLGYLQRGGGPTASDRLLATRFGCTALDLVAEGKWNHFVGLQHGALVAVPLVSSTVQRHVDVNGPLVHFARSLGISLGDR